MKKAIMLLMVIASFFGCQKEPPIATSIVLTSDNSTLCKDTANLSCIVYDQYNDVFLASPVIFCNDSILADSVFFSNKPGTYNIVAKLDGIESNNVSIIVEPDVSQYLRVNNYQITKTNSVGLVTVKIEYTNTSDRTFKYTTFIVRCYNAVNDLMYEEIKDVSTIRCQATGFLNPGQSTYNYWEIGYFTGARSIKVEPYSVILDDDTEIKSCTYPF